jgi:hypothetical protein
MKMQIVSETETPLANFFSDISWLQELVYLADIFNTLNECNLSMQGRSITMFRAEDKVADINETCTLLGYYAALSDSSVTTFRDNLSVPFSSIKKSKKKSRIANMKLKLLSWY